MRKITSSVTLLFVVFYVTINFAQVSPKKGVKPPADILEIQQMIQSEYSNGYYAEKFRERKNIREKISQGLLSESALVTDTVFALTLMGQFMDLPGFYTQEQFQAKLYDGPNPTGTVTDYYTEVSYNQLHFTGDAKGWYNVNGNIQNYSPGSSSGGPKFVVELIQSSDPTLNFADYIQYYDAQNKPHIGFLAVVHSGAGAEAGANNIWSHRWNFTVYSGGPITTNDIDPNSGFNVIIDGPYAIMPERNGGNNNEGSLIEIGVFAHEFGHIFGLPDLYDTDGSSEGLGNWCLMAAGSWGGNDSSPETPVHMSAWCKKQMGWVTPINISSLEKELSIPNVEENPVVYRIWLNGTITQQYFLVENRQKIGFDANIYDSGLLIYHVDDAVGSNQNENHYKVDLEQADGNRNLNNGQNRGDAGDPFPGATNNRRFDWNTNPDSKDYVLNNTFVSVRKIDKNGNTMIGNLDINPGPFLYTEKETVLFELAFGETPLVKSVTLSNYGFEDLTINSITSQAGPFTLLTQPTYPVTLSTNESLTLEIQFDPGNLGMYQEFMEINDNDPSIEGLNLKGTAYQLNPANTNIFYASANASLPDTGVTLSLNKLTGEGTVLGESNFADIRALTVHPQTNILYGIVPGNTSSDLVRVNATEGDAYTCYNLPGLGFMVGVAFDTSGILYGAKQSGELYSIDLVTGATSLITTTVQLTAIAFDPTTNELWATPRVVVGQKDRIFKIDLSTGDTTVIGRTGFNVQTNDLAFDETGALYGVIGGVTDIGKLISINKTTAVGTEVGETGYTNVQSLAYRTSGTSSVDEIEQLPGTFSLGQNYPNPFNPTTKIEFQIAELGFVTLKIYDVIGNEIATLVNEQKPAGNYEIEFNSHSSLSGIKELPSGVYFYQLKSGNLVQTKKMLLIK
ncbi:MAG: M6 family metalloprotease domain-containing protein [bacterium]|nr:M6 family metalloprotease domain-containing protein [bacterium]